jgi:hypothetical protein
MLDDLANAEVLKEIASAGLRHVPHQIVAGAAVGAVRPACPRSRSSSADVTARERETTSLPEFAIDHLELPARVAPKRWAKELCHVDRSHP